MENNKYKRFMEFLLEQIALFPDFDFSVGDSPEQSSRSFYRNLQTYTAHYALSGLFDNQETYLQFRKELQADVLMWQQICKSYAEIVKSKGKDKFQKLAVIVKAYREKLEVPAPEQAAVNPADEMSPELKEELGLPVETDDAEAEAALQQQQAEQTKKEKKKKAE